MNARPVFGLPPIPRKGRKLIVPDREIPLRDEPLRLVGETLPAPSVPRVRPMPDTTGELFPNL